MTLTEGSYPLSLAAWSLHREFETGRLDQLGMVRTAGELGFTGFEMVNDFFPSPTGFYLDRLRKEAEAAGVELLLIMCDFEGDLASPDPRERRRAARRYRKWVDIAVELGCHSIRVDVGSTRELADGEAAAHDGADGLQPLLDYNAGELKILIENHGGASGNADWIVSLIELVGDPIVGTLPDFGSFPSDVDPYASLEKLMPYAVAVSAQSEDFDADGGDTRFDFGRMMEIVRASGYEGYIAVEFAGERLSDRDGVLALKALLERLQPSA
jgi:L-ribulose-5-phosphate 3-epimerase